MSAPDAPANGEEPRIAAVVDQLRGLLVPGETLQAYAVERRIFALFHRRLVAAATSGRVIALRRGLLGGYKVVDLRWQDLKEAKLDVGILGADLTLEVLNQADLATSEQPGAMYAFRGLRKTEAQELYRACQAQEQAWREKRRVRDLEELRARSGGLQFNTGGAGGAVPATGPTDPVERLKAAKEMLDNGLITDSEYEAIKAKVVSGL
ncbi:MAG TPA: SHOCT domain-containing protein [Gemmatimonadales bacterium]|nr:SHOCT domain-containing protein [Gemmatimonadales bacterium]